MKRFSPTEHVFQTEWVDGRGLLLVLAFYLGGLGGGLYLISLYLSYQPGIVAAFFIVAVGKGGSHLLYLGKPLRFWRAFLRPQRSWISRGLIAVAGFVVFVGLSLVPGIAGNSVIQTLAVISAVVLIAYTGFALGVVNAIPFWNTALMPPLFVAYSLLGGAGLTMGIMAASGQLPANLETVEQMARWLMLIGAALVGTYLWICSHVNPAARHSVEVVTKGRTSLPFLLGVVVIGMVAPVVLVAIASVVRPPTLPLLLGIICELVGGFSLRYSILKAGAYAPMV